MMYYDRIGLSKGINVAKVIIVKNVLFVAMGFDNVGPSS